MMKDRAPKGPNLTSPALLLRSHRGDEPQNQQQQQHISSKQSTVHWDSKNTPFLPGLDSNSRLMSANLASSGTGTSSAHDILVPDLYDLILDLNRDCGFEPFFSNLIDIFETNFGAQRLSISVPRDATDIINIPWGLKALWNKNEKITVDPVFSQSGQRDSVQVDKGASSTNKARPDDVKDGAHRDDNDDDDDDDDSWDTDFDDEEEFTRGTPNNHQVVQKPDKDETGTNSNINTSSNVPNINTASSTEPSGSPSPSSPKRPQMRHTASFRQKFSLSRKLSFRRNSTSSSPVSKESSNHFYASGASDDENESDRTLGLSAATPEHETPTTTTTTTNNTTSKPRSQCESTETDNDKTKTKSQYRHRQKNERESLDDSAISAKNPHIRIFDKVRTLEWEEDPLIDEQGVVHVLDNDHLVLLQRKYASPLPLGSHNAEQPKSDPNRDYFYDTEQATVSPWSRSPAPSPAIRETNENPFFTQSFEMERAFDDPNPDVIQRATRPVDAIGYEDTYSIIHILLMVPSKSGSKSQQRSAPLAILSFMSTLIPFPSKLRAILDRLVPHITTAYVQACAHSNLVKLVTSLKHSPYQQNSRNSGSHLRRSPYYDLSPASSANSGQPYYHHQNYSQSHFLRTDPTSYKGLESLERMDRFYSSLREDYTEDPVTKQLEILASRNSTNESRSASSSPQKHKKSSSIDLNPGNSASATVSGPIAHNKRFLRKHRVRPHIRRFLHSYGASFMSEPEKASNTSTSNQYIGSSSGGLSSGDEEQPSQRSSTSKEYRSKKSTSGLPKPSNMLLRTMLDAIPVHVFMAEPVHGDVTWVSNRTLSFRGQTADEFIRDPTASVHPEDLNEYLDSWNSALEKGEPLAKMVQVRRFDGRYRAFFMRAVPLQDTKGVIMHWFCTLMDIHNQRQSHLEAIQKAHEVAGEQKYKSLAESTPIIVFTTRPRDGIQYANNKWFDYSGRTASETYGFQYVSAVHPEDREKGVLPLTNSGLPDLDKFRGKENKSGIYSVELRLQNKDQEYRWHLVTFSSSDVETQPDTIWFGTCTDIHDQKLIQQKLKEAKDAAQRTIESKSRFLSNMSHEIRTPLIGISGMVGFLLDTPLTDEQLDYCHTISSSSEALLMVINDILDLSKVESGKMYLTYSWFHVRRLVEEVNELLSSMAISKNLELNYIIDNDVPSWVKGDRVRLRQVMLNLIGNAIKFTDRGEIFTQCRIKEILDEDMMLEFQVHDTGRGFTEEDSKRMFQPYSQVHDNGFKQGVSSQNNSGSTSGTGGTGLGLVISRQLIQLHGGEMSAEGQKNQGSTFTFTCKVGLPTEKDHPTEDEKAKSTNGTDPEITPDKIGRDLNILVVCPYKFTVQSISHHILATVAEPARCEINVVDSVDAATDLLGYDDDKSNNQFTHIVVNINEIVDQVRIIKFIQGLPQRLSKTGIILLTTPTQRSKVNKRIKLDESAEPKVTFLPKPLKPSRYSVVFDPAQLRAESRDMKMMNAQKDLESHKSVFDGLSRFAYGKGYRILLAEDNLVNQKVMSKFLAKAGLKCDVAADGEVCTSKFFEKGVGYYSMILCDLDMPRKDGFSVCEEIREWEKKMNLTPKIPIVALSAYVMSDMSERCDQVGFTEYISKPVVFSHLKDTIIEILTAVETQ